MPKKFSDNDSKIRGGNAREARAETPAETIPAAESEIKDRNSEAAATAAPWWWIRRSTG